MDRDPWLAQVREEILEPGLPICDPHHHLWDHPNSRYLLPMLLGGVCTVVYLIFTGLLSQIAGFTINWDFLQELVLVVVVQSAAMALVYWPLVGLDRLLYPTPISTLE